MRSVGALAVCAATLCSAQESGIFAFADELHKAARGGDVPAIRMLRSRGILVNHRDSLGGTPLHDAAWAGEVDAARVLLEWGAEINSRHIEGGSTPLHYAVTTNRYEVVKLLLD